MARFSIILLASILTSTNAHAIVNGVPSEGSNFVVALVDNLQAPSAFCTGAYLAPKVVITAAHCVIEQGQKAPSFRVPIGRLAVSETGANLKKTLSANQLVLVSKVWTKDTYFNRYEPENNFKEGEVDDVAILFLERELRGKPIDRVATKLEIEAFKSGVGDGFQLGYGCIKGDGIEPAPNDGIPYLADGLKGTQKTEAHIPDTDKYLGFDYQSDTGNCPGDSGSPLLQKIGDEVVYLATVYAGGGTLEKLRNIPNVKAFGNSTVTWPYLEDINKQISNWKMKSLALLVTLIMIIMLASGIIALLLTFRKSRAISNVTAKPMQRVLTLVLAGISLFIGLQILTQVNSIGGQIFGGIGVTTALIAFYRVFKK